MNPMMLALSGGGGDPKVFELLQEMEREKSKKIKALITLASENAITVYDWLKPEYFDHLLNSKDHQVKVQSSLGWPDVQVHLKHMMHSTPENHSQNQEYHSSHIGL